MRIICYRLMTFPVRNCAWCQTVTWDHRCTGEKYLWHFTQHLMEANSHDQLSSWNVLPGACRGKNIKSLNLYANSYGTINYSWLGNSILHNHKMIIWLPTGSGHELAKWVFPWQLLPYSRRKCSHWNKLRNQSPTERKVGSARHSMRYKSVKLFKNQD